MTARARAVAAVVAAVGFSLSCGVSTGPDTHATNDLRLPPGGDQDVSKVAGTYVHPLEATSRLILLPSGSFTTQYVAWGRTWDYGGSFARMDSNLVFSFTGSTRDGAFSVSGLARGDTIFLFSPAMLVEQIPLLHTTFVRVREP